MTQISKKEARAPEAAAACCADLGELLSPELFKALGDPTRVALLAELARRGGPRTVSEIAPCCTVDLSVVSRHLATLRQAGILKAEKRGRQVFYSVRYSALAGLLRRLAGAIESCCPADGTGGACRTDVEPSKKPPTTLGEPT